MRPAKRGPARVRRWALLWALVGGCHAPAGDTPGSSRAGSAAQANDAHPTTVAIPASLRGLPTGRTGTDGEPIVVPCMTCHAGRDAGAALPGAAAALRGPHAGLTLEHGDNSCASCHDPERRDQLRLADGRRVELVEALALCGQCHGTQRRDYVHGAHGGMSGHWDTQAGPRTRNHCVHCHDPHRPKYPRLLPAPPPRDRFFGRRSGASHG